MGENRAFATIATTITAIVASEGIIHIPAEGASKQLGPLQIELTPSKINFNSISSY